MSACSMLLRNLSVIFVVVVVFGCLSTAQGQSGRQAPKTKSKTVAVPNPEPEPGPVPAASVETFKPAVRFVLGMDKYDGFSSVSLNAFGGVRRTCAQRLDEPEWTTVETAQRPMSRSEATNRAKAEKDSYVVWLRMRADTMSGKQTGTPNNAYIEYTVFAPTTAKVVTSGATYPRARNRGVIPSSRTSDVGDYAFDEAARAAADRILVALRLHKPRTF